MSAPHPAGAPLLLTPGQTATILGVTRRRLRILRRENSGPEFYLLGRRLVRYNTNSVLQHQRDGLTSAPTVVEPTSSVAGAEGAA